MIIDCRFWQKQLGAPLHIVVGLLCLNALVVVHELGHYLVARWAGVIADEFAVGMGPKVLSYQGRTTLWTLRLFPVGGFVSLRGQEFQGSQDEVGSYQHVSPLRRILILLAGVAGNFVAACVLFAGVLMLGYQGDFFSNREKAEHWAWAAEVREAHVLVESLAKDSPAHQAGISPEDEILAIDGKPVGFISDVHKTLEDHADPSNAVVELRRGEEYFTRTLSQIDGTNIRQSQLIKAGPLMALPVGTTVTALTIGRIVLFLPEIFEGMMKEPSKSLGGPVAIVAASAKASEKGFVDLLLNAWFLSLSLIILNLLPIPALDGGRALLTLPEFVGMKVSQRFELVSVGLSAVLLITLFIAITANDIANLLR